MIVASPQDKLETDVDALFNDPFATLRHFLTFVVPKKHVDDLFRGELLMLNQKNKTQPFVFVPLKLPDAPLFRDVMEKNAIPQVSLAELLKPFALKTAPEYLILAFVNRFSKNQSQRERERERERVTRERERENRARAHTHTHNDFDGVVRLARQRRRRRQSDGETERDARAHTQTHAHSLGPQVTLGEAYVQIYERQQRTQK